MVSVNEVTRFICLFHDTDRARGALGALEDLGFPRGSVQTLGGSGANAADIRDLAALGVPERDLTHLQDGIRDGGMVVSLEASEDRSDEIEKIFRHYSAGKIDETELQSADHVSAPVATPLGTEDSASRVANEAVIPVAQEELVVGKREVERGAVRVYRHTVETPVSEEINLHNERVVLEYREVNRPATEADVRAGQQDIELVETAEIPVVQKVARVVEEVRVGKVDSARTEVVQDSVRHTEVEVKPAQTNSEASTALRDQSTKY